MKKYPKNIFRLPKKCGEHGAFAAAVCRFLSFWRQHAAVLRLSDGAGAQIKCQTGDLGEGGGKGKHKGGHAELAAAGGQQIAAGGHQGDKQQSEENKQDKVTADGIHGKRPVVVNKSGGIFLD